MTIPANGFQEMMVRLQQGDESAAEEIFHRFAGQLAELARKRLNGHLQAKLDPDDVVQSVLRSFFVRQRGGQFDLENWDSLWGLLTIMTLRKCGNKVTFYQADRRDLRRETPIQIDGDSRIQLAGLVREPTPAEAAALTDVILELTKRLDERDRQVLELSLQGYSTAEISQHIGRAVRTVWRSLERIRHHLAQLYADIQESTTLP